MSPFRTAVAIALAALALPAAAAATPTIRVETLSATLVDPTRTGAVRAYLDTDGAAHSLPARTALGQIVALAAQRNEAIRVHYFPSFASGLVERYGSAIASATGGWQFTVDGVPSPVGADAAVLPRNAEVVWWLIEDFGTQGALTPLDLDLVSRDGGDATFRVTRFDAASGAMVGAAGAVLRVNGRAHRVPASGLVTAHLRDGQFFRARAVRRGAIRSEVITGRV
jgi:hypothetical protein